MREDKKSLYNPKGNQLEEANQWLLQNPRRAKNRGTGYVSRWLRDRDKNMFK